MLGASLVFEQTLVLTIELYEYVNKMCFYRYYYFPSCKHQQTVLVDYCERAGHSRLSIPARYAGDDQSDRVVSASGEPDKAIAKPHDDCPSPRKRRRSSGKRDASSCSDGTTYTSSLWERQAQLQVTTSTPVPAQLPSSPQASPELAAIAEELVPTSSSSILQQSADSHHSPTSIGMVVPFSHATCHPRMDAGAPEQTVNASHTTAQVVRTSVAANVQVQY
nr:hypothetical protein CFP56_03858 [Quercus suber]